jgi:uncharacterized protein YuzE
MATEARYHYVNATGKDVVKTEWINDWLLIDLDEDARVLGYEVLGEHNEYDVIVALLEEHWPS